MIKKLSSKTLLFLFFSSCYSLTAQERAVVHESVIWTQYTLRARINDKYTGSFRSQYRAFLDRENGYHLFFTMGITKKLPNRFSLGAGITNLNINRAVDGEYVLVPEIRPYQSFAFDPSIGKSRFSWRLMIEQRFFKKAMNGELVRGFNGNWRFRHKASYNQYLSKKLDLLLSSEIMVNAGGLVTNFFDQHRTQLLFGHSLGSAKANVGYMHWFVQTSGNRYENRHSLVIAFTHSI